jgi:hypothetical protein
MNSNKQVSKKSRTTSVTDNTVNNDINLEEAEELLEESNKVTSPLPKNNSSVTTPVKSPLKVNRITIHVLISDEMIDGRFEELGLAISGNNYILRNYISKISKGFTFEYETDQFATLIPLDVNAKLIRAPDMDKYQNSTDIRDMRKSLFKNCWVVYPSNGGGFIVPPVESSISFFHLGQQLYQMFNQTEIVELTGPQSVNVVSIYNYI